MSDNEDPLAFPEDAPVPTAIAGKKRFDEDEGLLSPAEIKKAKEEARAKVRKAQRDAEYKRIVEEEEARIKREEGRKTGQPDRDELVDIMIDLPVSAPWLAINGEQYHHGHTYTLPRHTAEYLREMMQRANQHVAITEGKDLAEQHRIAKNPVLTPALLG